MSGPHAQDGRTNGHLARERPRGGPAGRSPDGRRELAVESASCAILILCATALAALSPSSHGLDVPLAAVLVVLFAVIAHTLSFDLGGGRVAPTYLVLVPMLLLLPPGLVALLTACGLLAVALGQAAVQRLPLERVPLGIAGAWPAVGPAAVLVCAGPVRGDVPVALLYAGAFLAGCALDLARAASCARASGSGFGRAALLDRARVWGFDACIAPLGLLLAHAMRGSTTSVLLVIPGAGLLLLAARDRSARIAESEQRFELAITDALTRLGNRRKLAADVDAGLADASSDRPLILVLFDLDGFKDYNDAFGHPAGDAILVRLAEKLAQAVAPHGAAYRLGGDEFCALLRGEAADINLAVTEAAAALQESGENFAIEASYGAVRLPQEATSLDYALQVADGRMYTLKKRRNSSRDQTRDVLMSIIHARHPSMRAHAGTVAELCLRVGRRLEMSAEELDVLARAAELHDIGKVAIPDTILAKPGPLSASEQEFVRQHTVLGERILSAAPALRPVAVIVGSTHERWDGRGYPDGLAREQIALGARIIAACDAFAAMTAARPHGAPRGHAAALRELRREAGRQFDPAVVEILVNELEGAGATRTGAPGSAVPEGGG